MLFFCRPQLDVQQFWTRYFQSKLFNRNRTANRAAVGSVKDDPIFDKYLGEEDDGIEPKNMSSQHIYALLDLSATEGDQHEVGRLGPTAEDVGAYTHGPIGLIAEEHRRRCDDAGWAEQGGCASLTKV